MKKHFMLIFLSINFISKADYWTPKANYPGIGLGYSICFTIGTKGYVGCGFDSTVVNWTHTDFWEYEPSTNVWTQKANVGGVSRGLAVSFSIGNKGYVGAGFTQGNGILKDFWEYDPLTNIWTQKANFGGGYRQEAVGFSIGNMGYVGMGEDNSISYYNDLWQYNPMTNSWIQKASCPGAARSGANSFVIGTDAYIVGGVGGTSYIDLWQYNSITNTWLQKANFPSTSRFRAASFSICGQGYYGTGMGGTFVNDFWQYDPVNNTWSQKSNFMGTPRNGTSFFSIGNKGYLGLGFHSDFYEYTPDSTCITGITEISKVSLNVFPNPFNNKLSVSINGNDQSEIIFYDVQSRKLFQQKFTNSVTVNTERLEKGIYFYEVRSRSGLCKNGKVVKE